MNHLRNVTAWTWGRSRNERDINLSFETDSWVAIALQNNEEAVRAKGSTPKEAMRALDRELLDVERAVR